MQLDISCISSQVWKAVCPPKSSPSPRLNDLDMPLHALVDTAFHGGAPRSCKAGLSISESLASYQEGQLSAAARTDVRLHTQ